MKSDAVQYLIGTVVLMLTTVLTGAPALARRTCSSALLSSARLTTVLVSRDTVSIAGIVDAAIGYGHSNGWIETRAGIFRDLYDGTLVYNSIRLIDTPSCRLHRRVATVRHRVAVDIQMRESKLQMNLAVLQVWQYRRNRWVLIARQSCKIS